MAEKNSLWKNIREKAERNRRTGAKPRKPTTEMLRQERKIKGKYDEGGPVGEDDDKKVKTPTIVAPDLKQVTVEEEAPQWMKDKETIKPDKVNFWESFNPKKWGLNDYSDYSSFNSAFRNARESGEDEFVWNTNRYHTNLISKEASDTYWDSKNFLKDYYSTEPFYTKDTTSYGKIKLWDDYTSKKYGNTWSEYYDKIKDTPEYKNYNHPKNKAVNDTLDLLNRPSNYSDFPQEAKDYQDQMIRNRYLKALDDPSYYFSITTEPDIHNPVLGYQDSKNKKLYISNNNKFPTTDVHELSHKGDSEDRVAYHTNTRIPQINIDNLNKFGSRISQERLNYISDPSETEARKMSTLYYMKKALKKNIKSGKIKDKDLKEIYNIFDSNGGYGNDKTLPTDVQDLLELYKYQQEDLLKYLNNDFSYKANQKAEGGYLNQYQQYATGSFVNEDGVNPPEGTPTNYVAYGNPYEFVYERTELEKIHDEEYQRRLAAQQAQQNNWYPGLEYDPTEMQNRARMAAKDKVSEFIIEDRKTKNKTRRDYANRQEFLKSMTPEERQFIEQSNLSGYTGIDAGSQFRMAASKLLKDPLNLYGFRKNSRASKNLFNDADVTQEEYANASRLGLFAPLTVPLNTGKALITGDNVGSALSGEATRPLYLAHERPMGMEDVVGANIMSDIALDPLNFVGIGAAPAMRAGTTQLRALSPTINKAANVLTDVGNTIKGKTLQAGNAIINNDAVQALTFQDKFKLAKQQKAAAAVQQEAVQNMDDFMMDELYPFENVMTDKEGEFGKYIRKKNKDNFRFSGNTDISTSDGTITKNPHPIAGVNRRVDEYGKELETFSKEGDTVTQTTDINTKNFTTTGKGTLTNFRTGKKIEVSVNPASKTIEYSPTNNGGVTAKVNDKSIPELSTEYIDNLKDNINFAQESIPGFKASGSSVGVAEAGLPHLTNVMGKVDGEMRAIGDIDGLITQSNYEKHVKNKYDFVKSNGAAQVHDFGKTGAADGHIDFNIIHEDADGNVKVVFQPAGNGERSLELELFRQFDPEGFFKAAKEAVKNKGVIKVPYKAQELLDKVDPAVKTIMDAYESQKAKHANKIDSYINYGNVGIVAKAQAQFVKSVIGGRGSLGHQFNPSHFSNVDENLKLLNEIEFIGDANIVAKDPKRMQIALNDFYINNSILSRSIDSEHSLVNNVLSKIEAAITTWFPGAKGGNLNGEGLNNVKFGDPHHGGTNIISHTQLGLKHNTKSPFEYVKNIKRQTDGNYVFTPDELDIIKNLMAKHFGNEVSENISDIKQSRDLLKAKNYQPPQTGINLSKAPPANRPDKLFNDITKELGIRSVGLKDTHAYGNSWYSSALGNLDEAIDAIAYSFMNQGVRPKGFRIRKDASMQGLGNIYQGKEIERVEDFKRISNLLDGGLKKVKDRQAKLQEQITIAQNNIDNLKSKFMAKENKEYEILLERKRSIQEEINSNWSKQVELTTRREEIEAMRPAVFAAVAAVPVIGFGIDAAFSDNPTFESDTNKTYLDTLFDDLSNSIPDLPGMLPDNPPKKAYGGYYPTQGPGKALFKGYAQGGYTNPYNQYHDDPYLQYADGGYMYGNGGRTWKNIGAGAFGVLEGLVDTTFGWIPGVDQATDAVYRGLQKVGGSTADERREQDSIHGYAQTAGAVGSAILTGGATTGMAIGEAGEGLGQGISKGNESEEWARVTGNVLKIGSGIASTVYGNTGSAKEATSAFKLSNAGSTGLGKFAAAAPKSATALTAARTARAAKSLDSAGNVIGNAAPEGTKIATDIAGNASSIKPPVGVLAPPKISDASSLAPNLPAASTASAAIPKSLPTSLPSTSDYSRLEKIGDVVSSLSALPKSQEPPEMAPPIAVPPAPKPQPQTDYDQFAINTPDVNAGLPEINYDNFGGYDPSQSTFSQGGNITNNSLNLRNTMRYKRFAQGGFNHNGLNLIPTDAALHRNSAKGGIPIAQDALAEGGEIVMNTPDGGKYVVPHNVDGAESIKDFTFSKGGKYKELDRSMADGLRSDLKKYMMGGLATNPKFRDERRRPFDTLSDNTIEEQIMPFWQEKSETARTMAGINQQQATLEDLKKTTMEEYVTAYGGKLPNKYKGKINMPKRAKGSYVHNQMTQPMLAEGGPIYGDPASEYTYAMGGMYGDPYARGGQIDYTNDMYAGGGPMVSNVDQPFNGPTAQNRGGMYTYPGGGMHVPNKLRRSSTLGIAGGSLEEFTDHQNQLLNDPRYMMAERSFKDPNLLVGSSMYPDGGMMPPQDQQMMQQQMMQQQQAQQQMPQQGGQDQMMQILQRVEQAIMSGAKPEQIMEQLVKKVGMQPEEAQQVIQMAMQEMQGQQQPQQQMMAPPQQMMAATGGKMRYDGGGVFGPITEAEAIANGWGAPDNAVNPATAITEAEARLHGWEPETAATLNRLNQNYFDTSNSYNPNPSLPNNKLGSMAPTSSFRPEAMPYDDEIDYTKMPYDKPLNLTGWKPAKPAAKIPGPISPNTIGPNGPITEAQAIEQGWKPEQPTTTTTPPPTKNGLSTSDWIDLGTGALSLAGPAHQFFQPKPKPFQYKRGKPTTLDPSAAIVLANKASRESQSLADFNTKQNAPTSGSYLSNIRANSLGFARDRARTASGLKTQYDISNAGILNQFEQYNTDVENRNIDAMQQDEANWQTQRTNALYNAGTNLAGMRKDYKANKINEIIARNIGTNNWEYDEATQTIRYKTPSGQTISVPATTVVGTNAANLGTGEMQQTGTSQVQNNFGNNLQNAFRKANTLRRD